MSLATADVTLEVDFANLEPEVRAGLEQRVKRAARAAQKELDDTTLAAAALGDTIKTRVGVEADKAAARVRRAARVSVAELDRVGTAASAAGDEIATSAQRAAEAVERISAAAGDAGTLFDVDDSGIIRLNQAIEATQTALFDLDTVELERAQERSLTLAQTLRRDLGGAIDGVRIGLRLGTVNFFDRIETGGARAAAGLGGLLDRLAEIEPATRRPARGIGRVSAGLISLGALAAAVAPAALAGAAGVAAFAAVAVPSIARVIAAQTEMSERWSSLSDDERVAAVATQGLVEDFRALSRELAPEALQIYNGALGNLRGLLPDIEQLFKAIVPSLRDANQELGAGFDSPTARDFFTFLRTEAGPALDAVTGLVLSFGAAAAGLVQALAPLATAGVGVLTFFADLVATLATGSPELLQFLTVLIALRGPLSALGGFFTTTTNRAKEFAKASKGAALGARALSLAQAGLPGLVLAGATALVFFAVQASNARTAADRLADSINATNRAAGNNLDGYRNANRVFAEQLAPATARLNAALGELRNEQSLTNVELVQGAAVARGLSDANAAAIRATERNNAAITNIRAGLAALGDQYGITSTQATQLADAVGINLSKSISENGVITASVLDKINAYQTAVLAARDPTFQLSNAVRVAANESLTLEDRLKGLANAFNAAFNPTLALFGAQNRMIDLNQRAAKVLKETSNAQKDNTTAQLARRSALEASLGGIHALAEAEFNSGQSVTGASAALEKQLPTLIKLAGNSRTGRASIELLRRALGEMRTAAQSGGNAVDETGRKINNLPKVKVVRIKVEADTGPAQTAIQRVITNNQGRTIGLTLQMGRVQADAFAGGGPVIRRRAGGPLRRAGGGLLRGPGTGTSDSIPALVDGGRGGFAMLSNREFVVNAKATRRHYKLIEAINAGRFAAGGMVGRAYAGGGGVQSFATGGRVRQLRAVDIGRLLGSDIARGLRGSAPAIRKEVEKISKALEKKIVAIGQTVGTGFFSRITGSPSEINAAFTSLQKQVVRAFTGIRTRVDDLLVKRLDRLNDRLAGLATRRDALAKSIEQATQLAATVAERTRDSAALSGFEDTERSSAASIAATLRARLEAIRRFQRDVGNLTRRGLDRGIITQLVEGGPDQSAGLARTLAGASASALAEINALQRQINASSTRFGRDTADTLFDAGAQAGKGFLAGLKAERKEIIALMTDIAKSVAKTVKTTLKIKSPSVVMRQLAIDTLRGYLVGVDRLAAQVRRSVADVVVPERALRRAPGLTPAARTGATTAPTGTAAGRAGASVHQENHFHQVIADPAQIIAVTENRLVAALRGA